MRARSLDLLLGTVFLLTGVGSVLILPGVPFSHRVLGVLVVVYLLVCVWAWGGES